ncbi:FAD-binding oxidoreductase [Pseudorhodobacter sp.]|uniref:NAD(P)/FAD-dependent oxidoreductase n=1 Tax=Pseudorhodobacter sp. TaxID=1934400 RepID=UPI0026487E5B|nr:FAD-binding oxidoreductase [Pseudorhodobacter sp.]MDN5787468.1 FAD-binding oxidoreductase [Pseudorhodobacter sp.]
MEYDFIIIGGGIAGVSCAGRLAKCGRVLLLEGEPVLAHHASGRSAALYEPRYGLAPVVALSLASEPYFRSAANVLTPRGMMIVGKAADEAAFKTDCALMALEPMGFDDARAMVPILNPETVAHVGFADHAWDIDTDLLLQGFARAARSDGAEILTKAPVTAIVREGAGWRVTSAQGEHRGRILVNAAGAWADVVAELAGVAPMGITPLRRSMARIPAPGGHDVSRWPMIFAAGEAWYCKPDAGALIVSPAEEDATTPHDAFADDLVLAEGLARYEEMVTEPVTRVLANWAGLRSFAPDRVPVIGFDVAHPAFFWLAGQGGYGFQSAPMASQLAVELLTGRAPEIDAATVTSLSPRRFA